MPESYDVFKLSQILDEHTKTLYTLSNSLKEHYSIIKIPSKGGKIRKICAPDARLKRIQRKLLDNYLKYLPISDCAYAYVAGKSCAKNAKVHVGKPKLLKMDIESFFDCVEYDAVFRAVKRLGLDNAATGLISNLCVFRGSLPQGAPTSPYIANLVLVYFDDEVWKYCAARGITYTRYCDDLTFSGDFLFSDVFYFVERMLKKYGFRVNRKKTRFVSHSSRQSVCGITVNKKAQLSAQYRRNIRQQVYYLEKYGFCEELHEGFTREKYLQTLLGQISYALGVNPDDKYMTAYFAAVKKHLNVKE